jgi:hypothetical protein
MQIAVKNNAATNGKKQRGMQGKVHNMSFLKLF